MDLGGGDDRLGADRQTAQRVDAERCRSQAEKHHEPALVNCKRENARNHLVPRLVGLRGFGLAELCLQQERIAHRDLLADGETGCDFDGFVVRFSNFYLSTCETFWGAHECDPYSLHRLKSRTW